MPRRNFLKENENHVPNKYGNEQLAGLLGSAAGCGSQIPIRVRQCDNFNRQKNYILCVIFTTGVMTFWVFSFEQFQSLIWKAKSMVHNY